MRRAQPFRSEEEVDERGFPARGRFVITGGEFDTRQCRIPALRTTTGNYYETRVHMKALGGSAFMIIHDYGRQLVSPTNLLQPLDRAALRIAWDYLKPAHGQELHHSV